MASSVTKIPSGIPFPAKANISRNTIGPLFMLKVKLLYRVTNSVVFVCSPALASLKAPRLSNLDYMSEREVKRIHTTTKFHNKNTFIVKIGSYPA